MFRTGGPAPSPLENPQVAAALFEMKTISDMYQKMSAACFKKCVVSLHEADLNVGEMSCTDRCVGKYLQAQEKVGRKFQEANEQQQAGQ
jgi:import inner membrane translocase subunit TIM10